MCEFTPPGLDAPQSHQRGSEGADVLAILRDVHVDFQAFLERASHPALKRHTASISWIAGMSSTRGGQLLSSPASRLAPRCTSRVIETNASKKDGSRGNRLKPTQTDRLHPDSSFPPRFDGGDQATPISLLDVSPLLTLAKWTYPVSWTG